jgi:hypothetical protein
MPKHFRCNGSNRSIPKEECFALHPHKPTATFGERKLRTKLLKAAHPYLLIVVCGENQLAPEHTLSKNFLCAGD